MRTLQQKLKEVSASLVENCRAIVGGQFFSTTLQTQLSILQILRNIFQRIGMVDNRLRVQEFSNKKVIEMLDTYLKIIQERMNNLSLLDQKIFDHIQLLLARHAGGIETNSCKDKFQDTENRLIEFLFPWLKEKTAIDVGANQGQFLEAILAMGFKRIFAFEPHPELAAALTKTHEANTAIQIFPFALSDVDRKADLHLAKSTIDSQLFSALKPHPLPDGLEFDKKIPVEVCSLQTLINKGILPPHAGLLKINTEGHDLFVLQGMPTDCQYEMIMYEFWSKGYAYNIPELPQQEDIIKYMRDIGYAFSISIIHLSDGELKFVANMPVRISNVWGNTFCFRESILFEKAYSFIKAILPQAIC